IADRRGFIDPAADLADDALADIEQLLIIAEADAGLLDLALDFDVGRAGPVHHDVGDVVARQQRLERPIAQHVVADVVEPFLLLGEGPLDVLDRDALVDDDADSSREESASSLASWERSIASIRAPKMVPFTS